MGTGAGTGGWSGSSAGAHGVLNPQDMSQCGTTATGPDLSVLSCCGCYWAPGRSSAGFSSAWVANALTQA